MKLRFAAPLLVCSSLFAQPATSAAQSIRGTLDSNTPPYQAEELRWGMPRAVHIVVENAGHEDTLPNPEVQKAMADFLAGKDVSSRHIALPKPRFLSVEEAKKDRRRD